MGLQRVVFLCPGWFDKTAQLCTRGRYARPRWFGRGCQTGQEPHLEHLAPHIMSLDKTVALEEYGLARGERGRLSFICLPGIAPARRGCLVEGCSMNTNQLRGGHDLTATESGIALSAATSGSKRW